MTMDRYSIIHEKNPREIVLLRGRGCRWRRCRFCDYHMDFSKDENANLTLNRSVLSNVTGIYGTLEAINSGSFYDLDDGSIEYEVRPMHISESHPLANINKEFNAVFVKGNAVDDLMFYGKGAGPLPTGSAVMGDVIEIAKTISK